MFSLFAVQATTDANGVDSFCVNISMLLHYLHSFKLIFLLFNNDDMRLLKGHVTFLLLIFLLNCISNRLLFNLSLVFLSEDFSVYHTVV